MNTTEPSTVGTILDTVDQETLAVLPAPYGANFDPMMLPPALRHLLTSENRQANDTEFILEILNLLRTDTQSRQVVTIILRMCGHKDLAAKLNQCISGQLSDADQKAIVDSLEKAMDDTLMQTVTERVETLKRSANNPNVVTGNNVREFRELANAVLGDATVRNEGPRTPRNAECPCKSGRKYKKCCGRGK